MINPHSSKNIFSALIIAFTILLGNQSKAFIIPSSLSVGTCDPITNTYTLSFNRGSSARSAVSIKLTVDGTLVKQFLSPLSTEAIFEFTGLVADGKQHNFLYEGIFPDGRNFHESLVTYTAPASCSISKPVVTLSPCSLTTNTYTLNFNWGTISKTIKSIRLTIDGTLVKTINLTATTSNNIDVTGLMADGNQHTLFYEYVFADGNDLDEPLLFYNAPVSCSTINPVLTVSACNVTTNSYTLNFNWGIISNTITAIRLTIDGTLVKTISIASSTTNSADVTGLLADGNQHALFYEYVFANGNDIDEPIVYFKAPPSCSITIPVLTVSACNAATNTYTLNFNWGTIATTITAIRLTIDGTLVKTINVSSSTTNSADVTGLLADGNQHALFYEYVFANGNDLDEPLLYFLAPPSCCNRSPGFTVTVDCPGLPATFVNTTTSITGLTFNWNFGDGSPIVTNNSLTLNHTYALAGTYTVNLTSNGSCSGSISESISVTTCPPPCKNCIGSFAPETGKYILSAWVKEGPIPLTSTYVNARIMVSFAGGSGTITCTASGPIIDGWQRIEQSFDIPSTASSITIQLNNGGAKDVYFDDIRVHPFAGSMKSYVYDPISLKLVAELDENNYATIYEYDPEGKLIRVKKETEKGVATIKETRENTIKR